MNAAGLRVCNQMAQQSVGKHMQHIFCSLRFALKLVVIIGTVLVVKSVCARGVEKVVQKPRPLQSPWAAILTHLRLTRYRSDDRAPLEEAHYLLGHLLC